MEDTEDSIECEFIKIRKSAYTITEDTKCGLYSNSVYTFPDFGTSKWVICGYLKLNYQKYLDQGLSTKQMLDRCLKHLNFIPEPLRKTKKIQKPKYGNLQPLVSPVTGEYDVAYKDDRIIVRLITDDRQNPNFWGEGERY